MTDLKAEVARLRAELGGYVRLDGDMVVVKGKLNLFDIAEIARVAFKALALLDRIAGQPVAAFVNPCDLSDLHVTEPPDAVDAVLAVEAFGQMTQPLYTNALPTGEKEKP